MMEMKGEARRVSIKGNWDAILKKEGEEGLKKLEEKMAEVGYPLKYNEIKAMAFYPTGLDAISIAAIKEIFNYTDKDLEEIGALSVNFSWFFKIFLKYFGSLSLIADQVPKMWKNYYTVGSLEVVDYSEEKRYVIMRLKDYFVKFGCPTIKGYSKKVLNMILKKPVICEETKCTLRGDEYHEFLLKW